MNKNLGFYTSDTHVIEVLTLSALHHYRIRLWNTSILSQEHYWRLFA